MWRIWSDHTEGARHLTRQLRDSSEPKFQGLREAIGKQQMDPEKTVLCDLFPDGGSDYGLIIAPDGTPYSVDLWWGSNEVTIKPLRKPWMGLALYAGWVIFNEEGSGFVDPLNALGRVIERNTEIVRRTLMRDEFAHFIEQEGFSPDRVLCLASNSLGISHVVMPDGSLYLIRHGIKADSVILVDSRKVESVEARELCGPYLDAAQRLIEESESASPEN
jgi:hypothetical protein